MRTSCARCPVNVNYRYVADELAYLAADADLVALLLRRRARGARSRRMTRPERSARAGHVATSELGDRRSLRRAWSRPARRSRDFGATQCRTTTTSSTPAARPGCRRASSGATRTSSSRRSAAGTPVARRSTRPEELATTVLDEPRRSGSGRSCRRAIPAPTSASCSSLGPLVHASGQWSAARHAARRWEGRALRPPRTWTWRYVLELVERERIVMLTLVGDAERAPAARGARARPGRARHVVAAACSVRAAAS